MTPGNRFMDIMIYRFESKEINARNMISALSVAEVATAEAQLLFPIETHTRKECLHRARTTERKRRRFILQKSFMH
jgi:hypothetical protein